MGAEFFMMKAELLKNEVRSGQRFNSNIIRLGDLAEDEGAE
jgi:hypothetical protein